MANAFAGTLHLGVQASRTQRIFVTASHGVAVVVVALLSVHRPWFLIVLPLIVASLHRQRRRAALCIPASIVHLRWPEEGSWVWQTADHRWHEGDLCNVFVAGTALIVLTFRENEHRLRRTRCLLLRDALSARAHRQLRARLTINPPVQHSSDA